MPKFLRTLAPLALVLATSTHLRAEARHLHLEVGDPDRRDQTVPLAIDTIVDTHSGDSLTPAQLATRLADTRIVFVGESHTSIEFHNAQLRLIEELHRAGREVLIGLEMYPYTQQKRLDEWTSGLYTEEGFVELSDWYDSWGYHWNYYREIFGFARRNGLEMLAVNTPREVVREVRKKGFADLTEEEAAHIPASIDIDSEEHRQLFKSYFDEEDILHFGMTDEQWEGMFHAQCTWDATMGYNSVRGLEERGGENAIMVVLIGSGHVAYGLGIERQSAQWFDGKMASVIPTPVRDDDDEPVAEVQASYADFVWGLPAERDPLYPRLGLSTRSTDDELKVILVSEQTVAERAGFAVGDILLAIEGQALTGKKDIAIAQSHWRWGDATSLTVRRGEETLELTVEFKRQPPNESMADDAATSTEE